VSRDYRSVVGAVAVACALVGCHKEDKPASAGPAMLFVSSEESGAVTFIDLATRKTTGAIAAGKRPRGVQVSPDGKTVYVALSGSPNTGPGGGGPPGAASAKPKKDDDDEGPADKSADGIGVIDIATQKLTTKLKAGSDPEQLAVAKDGLTLYVSNEDASQLAIVDVAKNAVRTEVGVGKEPEGVTLSPDGQTVWVTCEAASRVDAIDIKSGQNLGSVDVGARPRAMAISKDGARMLVTLENAGSVALIDPLRRTLLRTVKLAGDNIRPMGIVLSPDNRTAYVTTGRGKKLFAIDADSFRELWSLEVGDRPWGVAVSADGSKLYTANGPSNDVSVIDVESHAVVARVPVPGRPWGVALRP
jgi:YVTN family beta-propeller protein